jgi:hypothetical protein
MTGPELDLLEQRQVRRVSTVIHPSGTSMCTSSVPLGVVFIRAAWEHAYLPDQPQQQGE